MLNPSTYELKLMRHLWQHDRMSAREIHTASEAETGWSYSTTRKALERMTAKGLIEIEAVHGLKTYAATKSKLHTMASLIQEFANNILDTDGPLPAATFAHSKVLAPEEIDDLVGLLEELDQKNEEPGNE